MLLTFKSPQPKNRPVVLTIPGLSAVEQWIETRTQKRS